MPDNVNWGPRPSYLSPDQPWPPVVEAGPDEGIAKATMSVPPLPATTTEVGNMTRGELRSFLKSFLGVDLPVTIEDLYDAASRLKGLTQFQEQLRNIPIFGTMAGKIGDIGLPALIQQAASTLIGYGQEYFAGQAPQAQSAYAIFSELMRPPQPTVQKKPTAEEFMSDFDQAFRQSIEGMQAAGKISGAEAQFAYTSLRSDYLNKYLAELGKFAEGGASPFALKEVTRAERGVAPGTTAGKALTAAVGEGVQAPTRVRAELQATAPPGATGAATAGAQVERQATALREQIENVGPGVAREFISLPRLMPAEFLKEVTPEHIRLAYAGSEEGAGYGARRAPAGYASSVRRV